MEDQMTIAIVDDNLIYRKLLMKILTSAGICVVFNAENGADCLLNMEASPILPQVIILDIEMPLMDGFEATRQIRVRWPHLKIIAHSSVIDVEAIKRVIDCGADMFLPKHCSPGELMAAINKLQHP